MNNEHRELLLRLPEVKSFTGLSRSTIYLLIQRGAFPKPIPLVGRTVAWLQSDVDSWVQERIREAKAKDGRA